MKKRNVLVLAGLAVLVLAIGVIFFCHQSDAQGSGKKPIDFTLQDINGKTVKLSTYRGKVVIVDVWATWCPYCVQELPNLIRLQNDAIKTKKPLRVIGISVDTDKSAVPQFVKDHGINYPVLYSEKQAMKPFGEIYGLPTKFIIDKKGVLVDKIIGAVDEHELAQRAARYLK